MQRKTRRQTSIFFILIFLSLGLFVLDKQGWLNWLKRPVEIVVNPAKKIIYQNYQSLTSHFSLLTSRQDPVILGEKIKVLEQELALLKVETEELKEENDKMRHLLGAPLPASWQFLPAKVLSLKQQILVIDQGSDSKVEEGMVIISPPKEDSPSEQDKGGVLIGRVTKVNPRSSQVTLISHAQSQVAAEVLTTGAKGAVGGSVEGKIALTQVLQKENLQKDQLVVTTGENQQFPKSLLVGKIVDVEKIETEVYQKAFLQPLVDFGKLELVFVKL